MDEIGCVNRRREKRVVERCKQERRRFPGDACQRKDDAGDDARQRGRHNHGEYGARPRGAKGERALAQRVRHEQQELLGRARDDRNHHDAEREPSGQRAEVPSGRQNPVGEDADNDRRHAVERVCGERTTEPTACPDIPTGRFR
jgi:hypothetical protein